LLKTQQHCISNARSKLRDDCYKPVTNCRTLWKSHTSNKQVTFFDCESTVLLEFVPAGQTIKPVLLLCGFATFEEGIPQKIYGITIE
jgi:hypothetical protein